MELTKERLLIIAPHADDEVLGCTGLIDYIKKRGGIVQILFATNGATIDFTESGIRCSSSQQRQQEIVQVADYLKYDYYRIAFPDHHLALDTLPRRRLIEQIEKDLCTFRPTIIAVTPKDDYNQDHQACADALAAAARPVPDTFKPFSQIILNYVSVSNYNWDGPTVPNPNFFIPLETRDVERKKQAMSLYASQLRTDGHERSPEGIEIKLRYWGLRIGTHAAEPFFATRITPINQCFHQ